MTFDEFTTRVQERGGFDTRDHAERATRAVLAVLGQWLAGGEPSDLAAQLPRELAELARYHGRPSHSAPPSSIAAWPNARRPTARRAGP